MNNQRKHNEICMLNHLNVLINYNGQQITTDNFFSIAYTFPPVKHNYLRLDLLVCITAKHDLSRNLPRAQILDP
jgi:hypothetical protein